MKNSIFSILVASILISCSTQKTEKQLDGTWKAVSGTTLLTSTYIDQTETNTSTTTGTFDGKNETMVNSFDGTSNTTVSPFSFEITFDKKDGSYSAKTTSEESYGSIEVIYNSDDFNDYEYVDAVITENYEINNSGIYNLTGDVGEVEKNSMIILSSNKYYVVAKTVVKYYEMGTTNEINTNGKYMYKYNETTEEFELAPITSSDLTQTITYEQTIEGSQVEMSETYMLVDLDKESASFDQSYIYDSNYNNNEFKYKFDYTRTLKIEKQ